MASFQEAQSVKKLPFASLVRDNKLVLFGKFNDALGITKTAKRDAWNDIHSKMMAMGVNLIPPQKDWTYLRDVVWRNMVESLKKKMDRKRQTGAGRVQLLEHEKVVLDVLGGEGSPVITGLLVEESLGPAPGPSGTSNQDLLEPSSLPLEASVAHPGAASHSQPGHSEDARSPITDRLQSRSKRLRDIELRESEKLDLELKFLKLRNRNLILKNKLLAYKLKAIEDAEVQRAASPE